MEEKIQTLDKVPIRQVVEKLDEYIEHGDYSSAEKHLSHWLTIAEKTEDKQAEFNILNEQIGLYKNMNKSSESLSAAEKCIALAEKIGFEGSMPMASTLLNAATAYHQFGQPQTAMQLFGKAKEIFEDILDPENPIFATLYNNMALTVMDLGDFASAKQLYEKTLNLVKDLEGAELEIAVTNCNLAKLAERRDGLGAAKETIKKYIEESMALLNKDTLKRDGYYAFVCEQCAPSFEYYGFSDYSKELIKRANQIKGLN